MSQFSKDAAIIEVLKRFKNHSIDLEEAALQIVHLKEWQGLPAPEMMAQVIDREIVELMQYEARQDLTRNGKKSISLTCHYQIILR